jgi:hypothetical protein
LPVSSVISEIAYEPSPNRILHGILLIGLVVVVFLPEIELQPAQQETCEEE